MKNTNWLFNDIVIYAKATAMRPIPLDHDRRNVALAKFFMTAEIFGDVLKLPCERMSIPENDMLRFVSDNGPVPIFFE